MNLRITRRQFLQYCAASATALGLSQTDLLKLEKALATQQTGCTSPTPSVIWMSGQNCSGCQTSLLNRVVDTAETGYYDGRLMNTLYGTGGLAPYQNAYYNAGEGAASDPVGLTLNVVNDVADLLVGDAVRAVLTLGGINITRELNWADDNDLVVPGTNGFPGGYITLEWLTTVNAGAGDINVGHLANIVNGGGPLGVFVLLLDGSIPTGNAYRERFSYAFDNVDDSGSPVMPAPFGLATGASVTLSHALRWMLNSGNCAAVICVGTCASYGGVPAASGNFTGAKGLYGYDEGGNPAIPGVRSWVAWNNSVFSEGDHRYISAMPPVINVPGCPPHPDWVVHPVAHLLVALQGGGDLICDLDYKNRPEATYGMDPGKVFCDQCPNSPTQGTEPIPGDPNHRAAHLGDNGCLGVQFGCKGSVTFGDCPVRQKNVFDDGTKNDWCVGSDLGSQIAHARHPCQGCIEPKFPDQMSRVSFYESVF